MPTPGRKAKKPKKSRRRQLAEYAGFSLAMLIVRLTPHPVARAFCRLLASAFFLIGRQRRRLAIENLQRAFGGEKSPAEIRRIARRSIDSFLMTCFEMMWVTVNGWPAKMFEAHREEFEQGRQRIAEIYEKAGGIIFVTPHLGNWEIFLHLARLAEVPLTIVARPLDNPLLERRVSRSREATGQRIIYKKNAMFVMEEALRRGTSVGILADQSSRGIPAPFFGRPAHTTVIPAILAHKYNRPIVVVACVREGDDNLKFRGLISDPIWPNLLDPEGAEIERLTGEMNRWMETFIRIQPDQWLWMHDRWKRVSRPLQIG
jgi:KDO2-lipid IV(A) lauroyltransferase